MRLPMLSVEGRPLSLMQEPLSAKDREMLHATKLRLLDMLMFSESRNLAIESRETFEFLVAEIISKFELSYLAPVLWLGTDPAHVLKLITDSEKGLTRIERRHTLRVFIQAMKSELRGEQQGIVSPSLSRLVSNDN